MMKQEKNYSYRGSILGKVLPTVLFTIVLICTPGIISATSKGQRDVALRWGHTSLGMLSGSSPYDTGLSAGVTVGVNRRLEFIVTGGTEVVPVPFRTGYVLAELSLAVLGDRVLDGGYAGSLLNTHVALGIMASPHGIDHGFGPSHLVLTITPLSLGTPLEGRRENLMKMGVAWAFREQQPSFSFFWNLYSIDTYLSGTWRDVSRVSTPTP